MHRILKTKSLVLLLVVALFAQLGLVAPGAERAAAADKELAQKPYMGWSSYSMQVYDGPSGGWTSAAKIKQMSDAMHEKLQSHGYNYINIDAGWNGGMDEYARPIPSETLYPDGFQSVIDYVHANGQKIGIYLIPGLSPAAYEANLPIYGTESCHIRDITKEPVQTADYWKIGYKIDFNKSPLCAQAYIDSIADLIGSWGIDFVKFDSVTPGSGHNDTSIDARDDVAAWSKALARHNIWFELSWALDHNYADVWKKYANGWRVDWDVESYDPKVGLTQWANIARLFPDAAIWWRDAGPRTGWNDFDSLNVGNGAMDGLTKDERQTAMTFWAVSAAPLYTGNDLTRLDSYGLQLLTNDEVIAIDQAGRPAHPVSTATSQQVWYANNGDGTYNVAVFNLGTKAESITVNWSDIGLDGPASVRDLWSHSELGTFEKGYTAESVDPHASRLFKVTAKSGTSFVNDDDTGFIYDGAWTRNGGKEVSAESQDLTVNVGSAAPGLAAGATISVDGSETLEAANGGNQVNGLLATPADHYIVVNDDDADIHYTGVWNDSNNRGVGDYLDDAHWTQGNGNYFEYAFKGTGIDYITEKEGDQGNVDVYLDDALQGTADTDSDSGRSVQQTVYSIDGLDGKTHTLKGVKQSGGYALLDALKVHVEHLIDPAAAAFDSDQPADVQAALKVDARYLKGVTLNGSALASPADYTVASGTVTVKKDAFAGLAAGDATLAFSFAGGDSETKTVTISGQSSAINPKAASFDKKPANQADVSTTLTLNGNTLVGIANGDNALTAGADYTVAGNTVTVKKSYLAGLPVGTAQLAFSFSGGAPQTLAINVTDTSGLRYVLVNNSDAGIAYSGSWNNNGGRPYGDYQGDVQFTENNGDSFTYVFSGTGIGIVTEKDNSQGDMEVYLDGQLVSTADTRSTVRQGFQTVYSVSGLPNGQHTLKGVKKNGQFMLLDALRIEKPSLLGEEAIGFDPAQPADATVTLLRDSGSLVDVKNGTKTLSAGTDYTVTGNTVTIRSAYLASLPAGATTLTFGFKGDAFSDIHYTTADGDAYSYTFKGTGFALTMPTGPSQGDFEVYVDGESKGTGSAMSASLKLQQNVFHLDGLTNGMHTVKVVKTSGDLLLADGLAYTVAGADAVPQTPSGPVSQTPAPEKVQGSVEGASGSGAVSVDVSRTTLSDGTKRDELSFSGTSVKDAIAKQAAAGAKSITLAIPDAKDAVSETKVTIAAEIAKLLADGKQDLKLSVGGTAIVIPAASFSAAGADLVFTIKPLKSEADRSAAQSRANASSVVKAAYGKEAAVIGRPLTIDTNLQGHDVDVVLPLGEAVGAGANQLGVYVEHSDGSTELKRGEIVDLGTGKGLKITVNKFSTFTLLKLGDQPATSRKAYIQGFADGTFRPGAALTRAQIATIVARLGADSSGTSDGQSKSYKDVAASHWAAADIAAVGKLGLMNGYADGTFRPDQPVTRAEMAALAVKLAQPSGTPGAGFGDTAGSWAEAAIKQAQGAGWIGGYGDGSFRPGQALTRAEAVTMLNRVLGREPAQAGGVSKWSDVPAGHWALADLLEASAD
ncbi:S-layer homology domain-containing protein [Cohnella sp. OV330]|uniref:X2-like carbohydrate binding domain-containing protein n=1 Tax=Cohnella sp. OV330 TaxID=1855288 RepID=UPI0008E98866|nr:X2-like carbohydrate binding domain-containing protein [Cohnella sp. OV330]SFB37053.1 S-layer homology domain-containing protein [Cohnella sp. OV330]